jgi:hypothetical protein
VSPEHRNLGLGKAMFGHLGRVAEENDCARLDWSVLKVRQFLFGRHIYFLKVVLVERAINRVLRKDAGCEAHGRMVRHAPRVGGHSKSPQICQVDRLHRVIYSNSWYINERNPIHAYIQNQGTKQHKKSLYTVIKIHSSARLDSKGHKTQHLLFGKS